MYPIFAYGTPEQKAKFLPKMAQGELIGCFGLTEPDAGSDPASMKTRAVKVDKGWRLNGSKMWITNAPIADLAIIWAKVDEQQIRGFIVERESKGFTTNEIKHKLSLRSSITGEIVLEDCFVPEQNYLPGTDKGLVAALGCLTKARYGIAWGAMGAAIACYEIALQYAKERIQFGKPIASFQLIQADLANMFTEIVKTQILNLQLGRLMDQNRANYVMVSLAKMNACREALTIARQARNLLGANGIMLEYHVIRHMNNLESVFTYEGTDNMHHLIVGKHITGLSAFD
jgi:glutaryl-CoA dehydrogenase